MSDPVEVLLKFPNAAAAAAGLALLAGAEGKAAPNPKGVGTAVNAGTAVTATQAKPTQAASAPATQATGQQAKPSASPAPAPGPAAKTYPESGIPELIQALQKADKGNVPKLKAILSKYGATKGGELKPEDFDAVKADFEALLPQAEAEESLS